VTRTVKVKLTADHADLKTKLKEAGDAAKKMGATTAAAAGVATAGLKGTERAADDLGDALDDAADQGKGLASLAADIRKLDNEITKAEISARDLAREFARTGDNAVLDKLKKQRRELTQMRNVRKLLPGPVEAAAAGAEMATQVGGGLAQGLTRVLPRAFGGAGGALGAAGAGLAAGLLPLLSAAISAGVLGAAGAGGIVGGLTLAAQDQRVAGAAKLLGERVMDQLASSAGAGSFVDVALDQLDRLEQEIDALDGDISGILGTSANNLKPVIDGVVGFVRELIPDLRTALEQARPIFDSIAKIGPQLGDLVGDVLMQMADNAPAAAMALEQLVGVIDLSVRTLSDVISILTQVYDAGVKIGLTGPQAAIRSWLGEMDPAAQRIRSVTKVSGELSSELSRQGRAASDAAAELRSLHDIANEMANANLSARESQVALRKAIAATTEAREKGSKITDQERSSLYDLARAANRSTEALDAAGRTAAEAAKSAEKQRKAFIDAAIGMGYSQKKANQLADELLAIPKDVTPRIKVEGASAAEARIQAIKDALRQLPGTKTITINTRAEIPAGMSVRQLMEARGGTVTPMAAGGIYPAANPPLIKFAEPETGGELFVPRKGISRARARGLLAEGAAWHGLSVSPMAAGGSLVAAAQGSLVNVDLGSGSLSGTRLDYYESAISARDAVTSLNAALKENGRAFGWSTQKGRDNTKALISGTRAAQAAAEAKYEETGSVAAANKVYDEYIRRLDASMKKMGVNAKTRRDLLKAYSERPDYGVAPSNSSARVRSVTDQIGAEQALGDARAAFAWTKPTFNAKTTAGQAELQQLFSFLGAAEAAAQSLYSETGNSKTATALYNTYLNGLRSTLRSSGMSSKAIDQLFNTYGRITLQRNRWGGMYERAGGGLTEAQIAPGGPTRYAWAESSTGGEAFIPRNGDKSRSLGIWRTVGERWLGQNVSGGGRSGPITVQATIPITLGSDTITRQVRLEVDAALGQVVDAVVYQTA
jgi:hypothetical protein